MSTVTDSTASDDCCPSCGALDGVQPQPAPPTVQVWTCTACGLRWACSVVNPHLRAALSIVGLLPTRELRTAALLNVMRTEVTRRSKEHTTMAATATTTPQATSDAITHLSTDHGGVDSASE